MERESAAKLSSGRGDTPRSDELRDNLADAGSSLRQAAVSAIPAAQEQLQRVSENVAARTESFEEYLTECIQDKPLTSVLVAAAAGLLAGALFLRR
jgi:ElaB/YqjD/DUF883 family membrane-anchored ribosome-binding protein